MSAVLDEEKVKMLIAIAKRCERDRVVGLFEELANSHVGEVDVDDLKALIAHLRQP